MKTIINSQPKAIATILSVVICAQVNIVYANNLNEKLFNAMFSSAKFNEIDALIKKGADVNYKNKNGTPVLHHASRGAKSTKILKRIINAGADLNASDNSGITFFHLLSASTALNEFTIRDKHIKEKRENEYIELANYIFKRGAKPNVADKNGITPLFNASVKMSKWLITKGLDPNAQAYIDRRRGGVTPLMTYAFQGQFELVKLLLENGANPHLKDYNGFHAACYAQDKLLDYGYPPYLRRHAALNYLSILKILSEYGVGKEMPTIVAPPKDANWSIKMNHKYSLRCKVNGRTLR